MIPLRDTVPSRHRPVTTWVLILANLAAFALEVALPPTALRDLFGLCGIVPARYTDAEFAARHLLPPHDYWPFLTSMFLHGGLLHVAGNMWMLWIFGDNVEDHTGPLGFLAFYLSCGLVAGLLHVATNPASPLPTVGASGAIAGVMGAYFVLHPRARIVTLVPVFFWPVFIELPAVVFLGLWFLMQFYSGALALGGGGAAGGVAWWAHVGGFLAGILLLRLFNPREARASRVDPRA